MAGADAAVLPSLMEATSVAALEAMSCAVPVAASRVGGLPEVIDHGISGFLHAPDDLEGMAGVLEELWQDGAGARPPFPASISYEAIAPLVDQLFDWSLAPVAASGGADRMLRQHHNDVAL